MSDSEEKKTVEPSNSVTGEEKPKKRVLRKKITDSAESQESGSEHMQSTPKQSIRKTGRKPKKESQENLDNENSHPNPKPPTNSAIQFREEVFLTPMTQNSENSSPAQNRTPEETQKASPSIINPQSDSSAVQSDSPSQNHYQKREDNYRNHNNHHNNNYHNNNNNNSNNNSYKNRNKNRSNYNNNQNSYNNQNRRPDKSRPLKTRYLDLKAQPENTVREMASDFEILNASAMSFDEVCFQVFKVMVESEGNGLSVCQGILEILQDGYGFLRQQMCTIDPNDVYVSNAQIKRLGLKTGDFVVGQTRSAKDNETYPALLRVECINDIDPEKIRKVIHFDNLVPLYPNQKFNLYSESKDPSVRIVDLITPIGLGQRGLIVAPPKAGKTTLLKQIANSLTSNHPELKLFVLLIDERPEEVTDMTRSVEGEVIASTFDQHLSNHIRVSEMVLERAKRLVEQGKDVVILLDSITRLARAYNIAVPSTGQTLSGGVNPLALYKPKKFFGSARNIEFGGSLTILATALIDTGSKMDDVIFEEFKGTGNMELHLDRQLFNKRIFPAINLSKSSTRREELLVSRDALRGMNILRRVFETLSAQEAIELLKKHMKQSKNNEEFLEQLKNQADS